MNNKHEWSADKLLLAAIVQSSDDAIIGKTLDGIVTSWNPAAERMYGYTVQEVIGKPIYILGYPDDESEFREILATVSRGESVRRAHVKRLAKGGHEIDVSLTVSPVWDQGQLIGAATIARDISSHVRLEQQFLHSQKMEAVGFLAGGLVHDCNNLLMLLETYAYFLRENSDDPTQVRRYADLMNGTLKKTEAIIKQFLAFGRKRPRQLSHTGLNSIVSGVAEMIAHMRRENIVISTALNSTGSVRIDICQVEQLLMNLVINARDAMPSGGTLTIATNDVQLSDGHKRAHESEIPPGRYQTLAVSDTGIGMDEKTQARIFEPFFSTKAASKGTGLGLSTVQAIAKRHGAYICVYSSVGKGTCIKVYFAEVNSELLVT